MNKQDTEQFINEVIKPITFVALTGFGFAVAVDYSAQLIEAIDWLTLDN